MTIKQIFFTSRKKAETLPGKPDMAVISITDPGTPEASLDPAFRHVLRLSFYDAIPADDFASAAMPGLFNPPMARTVSEFVQAMHHAPFDISLMVHCEYGVSRSAAVALFVEAYARAPLEAREYTYDANPWVIQRLESLHPQLNILPPLITEVEERRHGTRD